MKADDGLERTGGGIFAAVGTSLFPFDRLLRMLDELSEEGAIALPIVAQSGHCTYVPRQVQAIRFLPAPELETRIAAARVVICHGGAGLIGTCLLLRRRPVVVARRAGFGEIVNDHQLELCAEMAGQGRIFLAEDKAGLSAAIGKALADRDTPPPPGGDRLRGAVAAVLEEMDRDHLRQWG